MLYFSRNAQQVLSAAADGGSGISKHLTCFQTFNTFPEYVDCIFCFMISDGLTERAGLMRKCKSDLWWDQFFKILKSAGIDKTKLVQ